MDRTNPRELDPGERPPSGLLRKAGVGVAGGIVTAAGVVMLVTPGPGVLVTLAGLSILGREFPAIRRRLHRLQRARSQLSRDSRGGS